MADEFRRIGKGGREVFIQASYNPILDDEGRVMRVVKFATDVTPRVTAVARPRRWPDGTGRRQPRPAHRPDVHPGLRAHRAQSFNASLETLQAAMRAVAQNADGILAGADQIRSEADDLAHRTERAGRSARGDAPPR